MLGDVASTTVEIKAEAKSACDGRMRDRSTTVEIKAEAKRRMRASTMRLSTTVEIKAEAKRFANLLDARFIYNSRN